MEDRQRWNRAAFDFGREWPDKPCPYKKGSESENHWKAGRERRLMGDFMKSRKGCQG